MDISSRSVLFLNTSLTVQCVIDHDFSLCMSIISEMLAWASAQIHCQFHASESRVALPTQGTKQDVQAENDTVLIPSRGKANGKLKALLPPLLRAKVQTS